MSFHNDDVLQVKEAGLGWVCEFSFRLDEPLVAIFKGGRRWCLEFHNKHHKWTQHVTTNSLCFSTCTTPLKEHIGRKIFCSTFLNWHSQQLSNQCSGFTFHFLFFSLCKVDFSFPLSSFHAYFAPNLFL